MKPALWIVFGARGQACRRVTLLVVRASSGGRVPSRLIQTLLGWSAKDRSRKSRAVNWSHAQWMPFGVHGKNGRHATKHAALVGTHGFAAWMLNLNLVADLPRDHHLKCKVARLSLALWIA